MQSSDVLSFGISDELCLCHYIQHSCVILYDLNDSIHLFHVASVPHSPHLSYNRNQRNTLLLHNPNLLLFLHQRSHNPMSFLNLQAIIPKQGLLRNAL